MEHVGCPGKVCTIYVDSEPDNFNWREIGPYWDVIDAIPQSMVYSWEGDSDHLLLYSELPDEVVKITKENINKCTQGK